MLVPFPRELKPGPPIEQGDDVKAMQRALQATGALKTGYAVGKYGLMSIAAVKDFQQHHGLTVDGDYGQATHDKLSPSFDAYGRWLEVEAYKKLNPDNRLAVVHTGYWYYAHRNSFTYSMARPIPTIYYHIMPPQLPKALDCSGFFGTCYWVNKLLPKLGGGIDDHGIGNTWTMWARGTQVSLSAMKPGDAVFYDGPEGALQHVSLYVGNGRVLSNGHYPMGLYPTDMAPGYLHIHGARSYL
jgi:hypothetical protein